jgi:hypothetical protein
MTTEQEPTVPANPSRDLLDTSAAGPAAVRSLVFIPGLTSLSRPAIASVTYWSGAFALGAVLPEMAHAVPWRRPARNVLR